MYVKQFLLYYQYIPSIHNQIVFMTIVNLI